MAAGELADHQGCAHRVDGELPGPGLGGDRLEGPAEAVGRGRREGVGQPPGRVVDQDVNRPELLLGGVEQHGRRGRVGQVGFHGGCPAAAVPDAGDNRCGVLCPVVADGLRGSGIVGVIDSQERAQDRAPAPGQGLGGRRADAVIGARNDRGVSSCHHGSSLSAFARRG